MRVLDRAEGRHGELVLRGDGRDFEIISGGVFLMDTRDGRSERLLAREALRGAAWPARLLVGGLGVGFTLAEALRSPAVARVTVVEVEPAVIAWHRSHLRAVGGDALADPRVTVARAELGDWLARSGERFDAICLDVDNGPGWTLGPGNDALYTTAGVDRLHRRLAPGGTLTVWSAAADDAFRARLRRRFATVEAVQVRVGRGAPDVVYVARDG